MPTTLKDQLKDKDREIEHLRSQLETQNKKKSRQIETLARMSQSIAQGIYIREILQLIVTMTAEMLGSKICSLMLLDDKGSSLKIEATQSLSEEYKTKPPVPVRTSVSGRAILEKKHLVVQDVAKDPQYTYPDIAKKENLKSLLVIPMMIKEKSIGVLNCYTAEIHTFTDEEIQLVQAVANQAAVAIEHTRAIEKALAAEEALETRKVIERAKGILMRQQGLSEEASFRLIQRQAMDRRKTMKEVAEAVILSEEIQQKKVIEFFHRLYHFEELIRWGGHVVLVAIVFSETGLMAGFFLPGDSLLVTAGLLAATGELSIYVLVAELCIAAILGDSVNYAAGRKLGPKLFTRDDSLLFHKDHLLRAKRFYEKYGSKTIVIARFIPLIRTFAPTVAGIGVMEYPLFLTYNIVGGIAWVCSMLFTGYFLGRVIPNVDRHVHKIILAVIFLSLLPAANEIWRERRPKAIPS